MRPRCSNPQWDSRSSIHSKRRIGLPFGAARKRGLLPNVAFRKAMVFAQMGAEILSDRPEEADLGVSWSGGGVWMGQQVLDDVRKGHFGSPGMPLAVLQQFSQVLECGDQQILDLHPPPPSPS